MFTELPRPRIFAHRGASTHAPENTLAAFELAIRQNADAIELDVMLSADGQLVVIHDVDVARTTDGTGCVRDLSLDAIKEFDAGSWFGDSFAGESVPALGEVFEGVGNKIPINIELKNYASPWDSLPEHVAELVRFHGLEEKILISSFNPVALRRFRMVLPCVPVGMLAVSGIAGLWLWNFPRRWLVYDAVHPHLKDATQRFISQKQKAGLAVNVYTVNQQQDMKRLAQWGVDGIFTDDPLVARLALGAETPPKVEL